jgi:hypothetical protein
MLAVPAITMPAPGLLAARAAVSNINDVRAIRLQINVICRHPWPGRISNRRKLLARADIGVTERSHAFVSRIDTCF